jgi:hypothetical protein
MVGCVLSSWDLWYVEEQSWGNLENHRDVVVRRANDYGSFEFNDGSTSG